MVRKFLIRIGILLLLSGCATYKGVGSDVWYQQRLKEIEDSYAKKEVTTAEYLRLKNEADAIRSDYMNNDSFRPGVGFQYGVFR